MQQKEYKKNVLISAFNCSPYAGSEQYLGWSSAVATANYGYRTYVLTIDKTEQEIEKWFEEHDDTRLKDDLSFVYVSIPNTLWKIKGRIGMLVRYRYFQKQCVILGKELEKKIEFYYCHHVSWASFVQKIELYKLNAPLIIGPVGGGEKTPQSVEKGFEKKDRLKECVRNLVAKMATHSNWFNSCCKKATVIFVTTEETKKLIPCKYSEKVVVNQAISISADEISLKVSDRKNHEPLKVLMAGRSLYWKGFDFAIKAVGELIGEGKNIELHYYGSGPELDKLQKLANLIGGGQIVFHGNVKREELQKAYGEMHVCLNTSFHDSGCLVVLEAMAHGLPIICINAGGPGVLTDTTNAFKVDASSSEEIVNDLKNSVYRIYIDEETRKKMAEASLVRVRKYYENEAKMEILQTKIQSKLR